MISPLTVVGFWAILAMLTYCFIQYGNFGNDVFKYNLRMEGASEEAIFVISILFSVFWPLWWIGMFPIVSLIGRHDQK